MKANSVEKRRAEYAAYLEKKKEEKETLYELAERDPVRKKLHATYLEDLRRQGASEDMIRKIRYGKYDFSASKGSPLKDSLNNIFGLTDPDMGVTKHFTLQSDLDSIHNFLKNTYIKKPTVVYHGLDYKKVQGILRDDGWVPGKNSMIGRTIKWDSKFLSTSTNRDISNFYAQSGGEVPAVLKIRLPKGARAASISRYSNVPGESEVLLDRRSKFRIKNTKIEDVDGRICVVLSVDLISQKGNKKIQPKYR